MSRLVISRSPDVVVGNPTTRLSRAINDEIRLVGFEQRYRDGLELPPKADARIRDTTNFKVTPGTTFVVARTRTREDPHQPLTSDGDISRYPSAGYGLFAGAGGIPKGCFITTYYGVGHSNDFYKNHPSAAKTHSIRMYPGAPYAIDGMRVADEIEACNGIVEESTYARGVACMANSDSKANCKFLWQNDGKCWLCAVEKIDEDEQLFVNYKVNKEGAVEKSALHLLRLIQRTPTDYVCGFVQEQWAGMGDREWRVCYVGSDDDPVWMSTDELAPLVSPLDHARFSAYHAQHRSGGAPPKQVIDDRHPVRACCRRTFARWAVEAETIELSCSSQRP